jgi:hypothetical protein
MKSQEDKRLAHTPFLWQQSMVATTLSTPFHIWLNEATLAVAGANFYLE